MELVTRVLMRRVAALSCSLAVFVFLAPGAARAWNSGSKHDFSAVSGGSVARGGACGACHIPHASQSEYVLWARTLRGFGQEEDVFNQTSNPDYARSFTIACYDCHDNHSTVDNDPPDAFFDSNRLPQDVAFDDDMRNPLPANNPRDGLNDDNKPGYYENVPSGTVGFPNTGGSASTYVSGHYVKNNPGVGSIAQGDKLPCSDCHNPHSTVNQAFIRDDLGGKSLSGKKASTFMAYDYTETPSGRDDLDSRDLCTACHGTSDVSSTPVAFDDIRPAYGNAIVAKPTTRIAAHKAGKTTACTKCHKHNAISASCTDCHGFPPLETIADAGGSFHSTNYPDAENYSGGAGAHQRHKDALGDTIFQCEICHGPDPGSATWHNEGLGVIANGSNVNIMGLDTYWSPPGYPGPLPPAYNNDGDRLPDPGDTAYVFSSKGGSPRVCSGVACHGNPPPTGTDLLNWDDDMIDGDVPEPVKTGEIKICKWCHDETPATIFFGTDPLDAGQKGTPGNYAYGANVMGNGLAATAGFGAEVNGHGVGLAGAVKAVYDKDAVNDVGGAIGAAKECTVCHDAAYIAVPPPNHPQRTHFPSIHAAATDPRDARRLRDTINSAAIGTSSAYPTGPDQACTACHQNGVDTAADGLDVSHHGIPPQPPPSGGYIPSEGDPVFTRACRQCHDVHGANWNGAGRNLYMIGKWIDGPTGTRGKGDAGEEARVDSDATTTLAAITTADNAVVFTATSGVAVDSNSFDENEDTYDTSGVADRDDICATCHTPATGGGTGTGGGSHDGLPLSIGDMRGENCMSCHDHDYDNNATTIDAFMPSGCYGCHGRATADGTDTQGDPAYKGQYWPDGTPPTNPSQAYADDEPGAHYRHVQALAMQLYGETPAQVVVDTPSGATTYTKQKAICAFCHNDPGGVDPQGGAHTRNDSIARDPLHRVTVYMDADDTAATPVDVFRKLTVGAGASGLDRTAPAPINGDQAYSYTNRNCTNLVCHNQSPSPTLASTLAGNWDVPPNWAPGANADCSNTTCHATGTYTFAHNVHAGDTQKNYACTECHVDNYAPVNLGHGNGEVDMLWNNPASLEGSVGAADGFYDKDGTLGVVPSGGDTAFAYKDTVSGYSRSCILVYCHGGDNAAWGGGDITPVWNNSPTDTTYCGSCHDGNGTGGGVLPGGTDVVSSGNHTDHLTAAQGPRFGDPARVPPGSIAGSCLGTALTGCHTDFLLTTATHVDGTIQFANILGIPASPLGTAAVAAGDATDTDRCTHCHSSSSVTVFNNIGTEIGPSSGTELVKTPANWTSSTYELPCLTCHNGTDAATNYPDGTGRAAPDMLGTDILNESGAERRGHGLPAGSNYPGSPNPGANKYCTVCHNKAVAHLNNSNDTTFAGNRMLAVIEGYTLLTSTSSAVCESCHARVGSLATKKNVNQHSNNGYPAPTATTQGRLEAVFTLPECLQCHDPHGMTANNGPGFNIYMVPSTITIVPGASPIQATDVRFENLTGNYSFNDTIGADDDLCVVCHVNTSNPGYPMINVTGDGRHYINDNPLNPLAFYDADERGRNCAGCHTHNRDNVTGNLPANMDGFMPVACNSCHTYPGLPIVTSPPPVTHTNSAAHDIHAGDPAPGAVPVAVNNYAFRCRTCHFANNHNQSGMNVGEDWNVEVTNPALTNIRFDPARNGGSPTYNTVNASAAPGAPGVGGTGICALLYCHGNGTNGTNGGNIAFPADFRGNKIAPAWSLTAPARVCVTCHESATVFTPPLGTPAHAKHVGPVASGQYAIACQVCHYGTTTDGTTVPAASMSIHVNGSAEVSFSATGDTLLRVDGTSVYNNAGNNRLGAPYYSCSATYCHSMGTDTDPTAGYPDDAAEALIWNTTGTCASCHGGVSSMPEYADGTPKANKHDTHVTDTGYACQVCHWPTTRDGTSIFTTANHVNRAYNVDDDSTAPTLDAFTYVPAGGTCTAAACHGGHTSGGMVPAWSTPPPITCNNCHGYAGGVAVPLDVNNFTWDGTVQSKVNAAEYSGVGHGARSVACPDCHDVNAAAPPHDLTMAGANPYRLLGYSGDQSAFCNVTCHATQVRTHTSADMEAAGVTTKRTPWPWSVACVNCHDPHGDGANISMVQRELFDKAAFPLTGAAPPVPTVSTNQNLVFTDNVTGIDTSLPYDSYADNGAFSSICQECHEAANMVSFHDGQPGGTASGANHSATSKCGNCHKHSAGFGPAGCEGCHNIDQYDPGGGDALAPNVMGDGNLPDGDPAHTTPKPYDDGTYGFNVNGHGRDADTQGISNGDLINKDCDLCHDINVPLGKHLDGIHDQAASSLNSNPFHLVTGYINSSPSNEWDVQVTFDNYCWTACHDLAVSNPKDMRHPKDNVPAANAMRFPDHNSFAAPLTVPPMFYDRSVIWRSGGTENYGLCVSCHNPHGTNLTSPRPDGNNKMIYYRWKQPNATLCGRCHP